MWVRGGCVERGGDGVRDVREHGVRGDGHVDGVSGGASASGHCGVQEGRVTGSHVCVSHVCVCVHALVMSRAFRGGCGDGWSGRGGGGDGGETWPRARAQIARQGVAHSICVIIPSVISHTHTPSRTNTPHTTQ